MFYLPNAVFSLFSFTAFILSLIPLPWHLEAWNTGTCLYMIWTAVASLNFFINSIVWNGNVLNPAPVWCDISARIIVGTSVALPAASLCINRRLYHIATVQTVTVSRSDKRRAVMVDLAIGLGIPLVEMALQYIVQGHRFDILEYYGCFPATYNVPPAIVLVYIVPIVIGMISAVYCILTIRTFIKRRSQFDQFLSSNSNLTSSRYLRLICLAGIEVIGTIPTACWLLSLDVKNGIQPWISWANVHYGFSAVDQIPALLWRFNPTDGLKIELSRWLVIVCAFTFFGFFGFADEARKNYRQAYTYVAKRVGYTITSSGFRSYSEKSSGISSTTSAGSRNPAILPVFVQQEKMSKRDSFDAFCNKVSFRDAGGMLSGRDNNSSMPLRSAVSSFSSLSSYSDADDLSSLHLPEPPSIARPEPTADSPSSRRIVRSQTMKTV